MRATPIATESAVISAMVRGTARASTNIPLTLLTEAETEVVTHAASTRIPPTLLGGAVGSLAQPKGATAAAKYTKNRLPAVRSHRSIATGIITYR
jgi:hypothetical protein